MPRIRSIHPEACTSEKLARVSGDAERCYWRLQTHVDDAGRCEDHPRLIWAALFPLHDDVMPVDIDAWLGELEHAGLLVRYEVESKRYLEVAAFTEKQKPRHPTPTKLPPPTADRRNGSATVPPQPEVEREEDGGVGVGEGGGQPEAAPYERDFDGWWSLYPRKVKRQAALSAYQARRRAGTTVEDLDVARDRYQEALDAEGVEERYIQHASTFLHGARGPWYEVLHAEPVEPATLDVPIRDPWEPWVCGLSNPNCVDGKVWPERPGGEVTVCDCTKARA